MKCNECVKKQKIIDILHRTCDRYEARIKRFQTWRKKRREIVRMKRRFNLNNMTESCHPPIKSGLKNETRCSKNR